ELLARSVLVSALSSDGVINETVRVFNTADGFNINYEKGGLLTESPVSEIDNIEDSTTDEIENSVDDSEEIVYNDTTTEEEEN
ncbi:TPA: deoxyribonuclease, partial [Streptococcus pyogenes]|nr:deoxyribonuclease [Streptococcus pyogenes]HER8288225.1 deoxyribonuclease [Streptococcus pyogenes]